MKDFTSFVHLPNGIRAEFNFSALRSPFGNSYFVSVVEGNDQPFLFTMREESDKSWKIVDAPKVPSWILTVEAELERAILENRDE